MIENSKKFTWKVLSCNTGKVEKKNVIEELVTSNRMNSPCSKLFLNKCIKQNNIRFDENMVTGEDMNFVIDYIKYVTNIYYTGKSAYCYKREEATRITRIKKFPETYLNNLCISIYYLLLDILLCHNWNSCNFSLYFGLKERGDNSESKKNRGSIELFNAWL